ncbi:hypothetical protein [Bifidobacterium aesculapii]|nr:hypothetical protein [Bifidobacterium aesculapii]
MGCGVAWRDVDVGEYWAAWVVVLMVASGEAIEEFAQSGGRDEAWRGAV